MPDEERIEQLELEVKVLQANNKGLKEKNKELEDLKKKTMFLIKDIYSPKLKEINLQDIEGLIEQGREEVKDKIKAKIEEIENEDKKYKNYLKDGRENFTPEYVWARPVLQSLLEKEQL